MTNEVKYMDDSKNAEILASLERQEVLLERILKMYESQNKSLLEIVEIARTAVDTNSDSFKTVENLAVIVAEQGNRIDKLADDILVMRHNSNVSRNRLTLE